MIMGVIFVVLLLLLEVGVFKMHHLAYFLCLEIKMVVKCQSFVFLLLRAFSSPLFLASCGSDPM